MTDIEMQATDYFVHDGRRLHGKHFVVDVGAGAENVDIAQHAGGFVA